MGDDLNAFFAKKKDKKKKTVVKMDDVGQILERRVRRQEEHDQQAEDDDKRMGDEEPRQRSAGGQEDSEWIEFNDSNQSRLDGLKIKDMGAEAEIIEEEPEEDEEQKEQHESTRTWGQVEKKVDEDVETAADMAAYQKQNARPTRFVPSALRNSDNVRARQIDVSNQEMFPSLADASKIEKDKKEDTKAGGGWVKSGAPSDNRPVPLSGRGGWGSSAPAGAPPTSGRDREGALAAVKALAAASAQQAPAAPRAAPVSVAAAPVEAPKAPEKPAYVPPHLRGK